MPISTTSTLVLAMVLGCLATVVAAADQAKRPNVLFLMADQHRADVLGAVNKVAITPALDALAAEGVRFDKAYTSTPTCTPAR